MALHRLLLLAQVTSSVARKPCIAGSSLLFTDFPRNTSIFRKFATSIGSLTSPLSSASLPSSASPPSSGVETRSKMLGSFSIFKGKAALVINPMPPRFSSEISGSCFLEKNGCVLLKFFPAVGMRKYDWSKRQCFALSPTELGCLISLGPHESCEFFHDPSKKSSLEGQVTKNLSVSPISSGDSGYFMNLTVNKPILKTNERFSLPISKAEFAVMRTSFSFVLPLLLGMDRVVALPGSRNTVKPNPDAEWDR